jgi:peptidoglycan hydrolase-like protein with peptidoglycan-binding domain
VQIVAGDQATVASAQQKVATDDVQLAGAHSALATAKKALNAAESAAASYGNSGSYTMLADPGEVIRRGRPLYAINGSPTLLLYGGTPAWRTLVNGISPGPDVAELNANLRALGYAGLNGSAFTAATEQAVAALQAAHGLAVTGKLQLGSVAFEPSAVRVVSVTVTVGQAVQAGPIMTLSSTRHDVSIQLDASLQSQVRVGNRVQVSLPDGSMTPGVVTRVGKVATAASSSSGASGGSGSSTPTVTVAVRLLHPAAAGTLDRAPVNDVHPDRQRA